MAKIKRKLQKKVRIKRNVALVHKTDATRVERKDTVGMPRMKARPPADNGPTLKIKVKKK